ncbi:hypothetical protein C9374_000565 [Naegleria lovaniensis]|uniref:Inositol polyphosphate-related phosphatase domain-containing protein n=1 Tax=Naegleria lovaniensis TaxID=51637 RepID=A0AA88GYL8_NAELO|nr:uncharacterized protein C9374_000565 [Naegleria lovaniensis]KAG2388401.1 hypothetical protein C9374_000565 [Naegleria lovaniensis]
MAEKELDPRLLEIMKETGTKLSGDDLSALKTVSVKELIKLWEALAVDQQEPTAAKGGIKSAPKRSKKEIFEEWTKGVVEQYKKEAEKRLASSSQGSHVPKPKVMSDHEYNKSIKEVRSNLKKRIALYEQMVSAKEANDEHAIRELSSLHRTGMKNDLKLRNTSYYETILKKTSNQALKLVRPLVAPQLVTVNEAKNQPLVLASKQLAANGDVLLFLEIASDDTIRDLVVEAVPNQNELSCSVLSAPQIDKIGPEDLEAAVLKVDSKDVITVGGGCQMKLQVHYTDEETGQRKTQILSPIQLGIVDIIEQETKDTTEFENLWFKTGQKNETKETVVFDSPLQEAIDSFVEGSGMIPISEAQQEISTTAVKHTMQFFAKKDEKPILTKVIFTTKSNGTEAVVQTRTELENVRTEAVKNLKSFWENMKQNKEEIVRGVGRKIKFEKEEKVKEEHLKAQERLRKEKEEEEAKRKQEEEEMERMLKEQEEEERLAKEEEEKRRFEEQERIRLEEERIRHEEMLRIMEAERIKKEQEELEKLRREEEEKVRLEQKKREEEERRRKEEEEKRRIEEEEKRRREEEEMERMLKEQEEEERRAEEEKRRFEEEQRLKREEEERIRKEQARLELERKEAEERRKREQEEKERQELLKQQVENHRKARIQSLQANMQNFWNKFGQPLKTKEFSGAGSFVVKLHTLPSHQVIEVQISPPQEPNTCYKNVKLEIDPIIIGLVKEPYQVMIDELFPYNSASSVALALKRNEDFPVGQLGELKIMFDSATFEPSNDEIVGELQPYEVSMDNIEFKIGDLNLTQTEPSFEDFKTLWDSGIFSEYGMDTIVSGEHENPVDLVKAFCVSHDLAPVVHVKEGVDEGTCFFGSSYEFPSGDAALVLGKSNKFDNGIVKLKVQVKSSEKKITEKFLKSFCSVYKEHIKPVQMFENKTGHEAAQEKLGVPTAIQKRVLISKPSNPLIKVDVSKRVYSDKKVMLEYHIANNAYSPIENVDILMSGIGYESGGGEGDRIEPSEEAIVCKFVSTDVGEGCITPCLSYSVSGHPEKHELFNVMFGLKDELIPVYPTSDFFEVEWQQSPTFDVLDVAELMSTEISQVSECVNDAFGASKALNQHEVEESSSDTLNYMFTLPSGEDLFVQVVLDPSPKSIKYSLKYKGDGPNLKAYVQSLAAFLRYEVQKRNVILEGEQSPQIPEADNDQPPIEDSELPELPAEEDKPPELPVEEEDHTKEPLIDEEPEIPDVEEPPIDEEPELPADETPPEILDEEEPPEIPSEYEDTTHEEPPELPTEEEPELPPEDEELQEPELPQEENVQEDTEPPFVDDEEPPVQEEDVPELPPTEETEKVVHIEQQQQTPIEQTKQPEQQPSVGDEAPPKKPEVSEEETFAEEEKVLKQNQVDVSKLANTTWLKPRFAVHQNGSPNDKKIWEIDFFASTFKLFEKKGGKLKSTYQAKDLYSLERHFTDSRRSVLRFFGDKSHHDLVFESNYHRERFFECASCMRKNLFVWCPFVCAPGQVKVISDLKGSFSCVENGQIKKYHGECKVNAYAKAFEPIQVFCMTWNMGGKKAPKDPQELQDILVPGKYDLYAIATQESGFPKDVNKFKAYVENCLGDKYIVLTCITMWEIQLVVLTKKSHFLKISNIQGVQKATGFVKVAGNKGGVGISLCFNDTPMLFISSHLAANHGEGTDDKEYLNLRNQNAQEIIDAMCIGNPTMDISGQFDYIFVMGDTNYRVEMPFDEGVALARNKKYDQLVAKDQLKAQQKLGKVFYGFKENPITFPPSYKYKPGTLEFDNKKKRTPSYTDRILYKTFPACKILSEKYTVKFPECKHPSDHLPVQCVFTVPTHRPFVSVFTSETQYSCQIIFEEIVCKLAVREEIVNPTVTFYASWLDSNEKGEYPMTSKIANTKTPLWAKEQIPILVPATSNVEYLRLKHLTLTIRTGKPEISRGIENLIGTVILPLQNAVAKSPEKNPFKAPIHAQGGLAAGIMEGCYRIVYKKEDVGKKLMNVDTE